MTTTEKQILVNALTLLGPSATTGKVANNYATNHSQFTVNTNTFIHQNNDFLPWHRWFILGFEKELQNTNTTGANKIALPYWDWTSKYYTTAPQDNATSGAPLWDNTFLGQFNTLWGLSRNLGAQGSLATVSTMSSTLLNSDFTNFRSQLEVNLHNIAHNWVGGIMQQGNSPADPVFYFHHNMVDKIWQDWTNIGRTSSFPDEILPNKIGTAVAGVPNFPSGVPDVSPTSIIDSRASSVKVWFAENGKVILDKYTVSGTENYHYTGVIEAGSRVITSTVLNSTTVNFLTGNFTVPSGTTCNFVSGGLQMGTATQAGYVRLVPGFYAQAGCIFTAKINSQYFTDAAAGGRLAGESDPSASVNSKEDFLRVYPNPASGVIYISLNNNGELYSYEIQNALGSSFLKGSSSDTFTTIDLSGITPGIYLLTVKTTEGKTKTERILIK
ncbi:MAG TPA: tyrosinase family protein [Cyclobacteriaceae bacterium]|nr:tyrosinase family protein [Cyclobacteriaceae bacterium]